MSYKYDKDTFLVYKKELEVLAKQESLFVLIGAQAV